MSALSLLSLAPAAFFAGLLMFFAPCTLPIVPGYLLFIAGVPVDGGRNRRRVMSNAIGFVIGFSLIFIVFGVFASALGSLVGSYRDLISRAAGAVIIIFGFTLIGLVRFPQKEWHTRIPPFVRLGRPESAFFIGALFAFGWSPCIGPILGSVLLLASQSSTIRDGALLLAVFSLGLAVPFLVTALFIDGASRAFSRWSGAAAKLSVVGGVLLVLVGALMLMGVMGDGVAWGYTLFDRLGFSGLYAHF